MLTEAHNEFVRQGAAVSYLPKYVVEVVGLTERLFPVPTNVPPHDAVYQRITWPVPPPPPFNVKMVFCPLQIFVEDADADKGLEGT